MKEILEILKLVIKAGFVGTKILLNPPRKVAVRYLRGLNRLAAVATIPPILIAVVGIITGWLPLTACAGLWCTVCLVFLAIWGTPLGILLDAVIPGKKEGDATGARYLTLARGIILWEAVTFWVLSVVPIRNNPKLIPLCFLSIICLTLMTYHWQRESKWLRPLLWYSAIGILILCMIAFWFPSLTPMSAWNWTKSQVGNVGTESDWVMMALIGAGLAGIIALVIWLVRKISGSHSGGHGGHGHGKSRHPLKTFLWTLLAFWGVAVLIGTVRLLMVSDFKEQVFGRSGTISALQEGEQVLPSYGSKRVDVREGQTVFTIRNTDQLVRVEMPLYRCDIVPYRSGNLLVRRDGQELFTLCGPSDPIPGSQRTNLIRWLECKLPDSTEPVKVSFATTRKYN